jgi:hypothetical protein
LRDKVTSSAQSLTLVSQGSRLSILTEPHDELAPLFYHLVGALLKQRRHVKPECLGGL